MNPLTKHVLRMLDGHEDKICRMAQRIEGIDIRTGIALKCAAVAVVVLYVHDREIKALKEEILELKNCKGDWEANA